MGWSCLTASATNAGARAKEFILDNGISLVVIPDHRVPIVTHMLFMRVGSADDPLGRSGLAHYVEHLMFKGTKRYPKGQFDLLVTRNGGATNAFTANDRTYFYEQVMKPGLPTMMDLAADRLAHLEFDPIEAVHELDVVREERRSYENDPASELGDRVSRVLYRGEAYGHPILGEWNETDGLTYQAAMDFYHQYYIPQNAIVVVAGDVEPEEALRLAQSTYGQIPRRDDQAPRLWTNQIPACTAERVLLSRDRVSRNQVSIYFTLGGLNTIDERTSSALEILAQILRSEGLSPLYKSLVVETGLADSIDASFDLRIAAGEFSVAAEAGEGTDEPTLERALRDEVAKILKDGLTEEQVEVAKQSWLDDELLNSDDQLGVASRYGEHLAVGETVEQIEASPNIMMHLTRADINQALRKFLVPRCDLVAALVPSPGQEATGEKADDRHAARNVH
jgi:zinc protease